MGFRLSARRECSSRRTLQRLQSRMTSSTSGLEIVQRQNLPIGAGLDHRRFALLSQQKHHPGCADRRRVVAVCRQAARQRA